MVAVLDIATPIVCVVLVPAVTVPKFKLVGDSVRLDDEAAVVIVTETGAETLDAYVLSPEYRAVTVYEPRGRELSTIVTDPPVKGHVPIVVPPFVVSVTDPVAVEGETETLTVTGVPWLDVAGVIVSDVDVARGLGVLPPPVHAFTKFVTFTDPSPVAESYPAPAWYDALDVP